MFGFLRSALSAFAVHRQDRSSARLSVLSGLALCLLALGAAAPSAAQGGSPPTQDQNSAAKSFLALPFENSSPASTHTSSTASTSSTKMGKETSKSHKQAATHAHAAASKKTQSKPNKPASDAKSSKPSQPEAEWRAAWHKKWLQAHQAQHTQTAHVAAQKRTSSAHKTDTASHTSSSKERHKRTESAARTKTSHEEHKTAHSEHKTEHEAHKTEHSEHKTAHREHKTEHVAQTEEHHSSKAAHEAHHTEHAAQTAEHHSSKVTHETRKTEPSEHKAEHEARKTEHSEHKTEHEARKSEHREHTVARTTAHPAQAVAARTATAPSPQPATPAKAGRTTKSVAGSLSTQTRPDSFGTSSASANHTQDSPLAALGDAWKMLIYLVPMLLLTLGALHLLRGFYERTGRLPGPLQSVARTPGNRRGNLVARPLSSGLVNALVGGFHLNNMRQHGGGSIRLVESVPVGSANLHLIEVRGRLLLIGATSTGVSLLTELQEPDALETGDFRALLQAAAVDMDSLDMEQPDLPTTAMVGSLEEAMRDTRDSVARRIRRLHTVQEVEDAGA